MKKLLKQEDELAIERWHANDHLAILLHVIKSWSDFTVGDVLVKRDLVNQQLVDVSGTCRVPRKFKVVHVDHLGIPWIKSISVRGGLGNKLYPLTSFQPNRFEFQIDPEQISAIILGARYDPRAEYKRMRGANPNYGKDK